MTTNVMVSVCVVTYNHEKYLKEALDSILSQQTNFPFEICIGEDESTDNTPNICLDYASKFPDLIRLFTRSEKDKIYINGVKTGRYNTRETINASRGKYIAMCEGDDYWTDPLKLQKQVDFLELHHEYPACVHLAETKIETGNFQKEVFPELPKDQTFTVLDSLDHTKMFAATASLVFRKMNFFNEPWMNECFMGDRIIFSTLAAKGPIAVIPDVMSVYRRHDGGAVANFMTNSGVLAGKKSRVVFFENIGEVVGTSYDVEVKRIMGLRYFTKEYARACLLPGKLSFKQRVKGLCDAIFRKPYWGSFIKTPGRFREVVGWAKVVLSPVKRMCIKK
ncbi:glycosyltransferase [Kiritimatiellaeota bacterium B1221]|nr:glycosyltransferase [Kiritimatiellaeota bacterium B1221]